MSAPAPRLQPVRQPVLPDKETAEVRYWRGYKAPLLIKESNAITHLHFNPAQPHDLAFTSSTKVQILSTKTSQVQKTISKFNDTVYSGEFRNDGRLLVAGDATGMIQAFDTSSRNVLVTLKPTQYPVHVTKFHPSSLATLLSASDDRVARLWDLTSSDPLAEFAEHDDYIRTACFVGSMGLVMTGCYDGIVRLWDPRAPGKAVASYNQTEPVESVLALNDSTIAAAAGPQVKIWDLTAGRPLVTLANFQKTVTSLSPAGERGFLASSLDGHVKVFDVAHSQFPVTFGWKFGGPALTTAISPDSKQIATGLTSGLLTVRTRKSEPKVRQGVKQPKTGNFSRMIRGAEYRGEFEQHILSSVNKPRTAGRLKPFERHIKAFRWADALDAAFTGNNDQTTMVLEELRKRGKIRVSLAGRDDESLEPLIKWCSRSITSPALVELSSEWLREALAMYGPLIERSPLLHGVLQQLTTRVHQQVRLSKDSDSVIGMLDFLMA